MLIVSLRFKLRGGVTTSGDFKFFLPMSLASLGLSFSGLIVSNGFLKEDSEDFVRMCFNLSKDPDSVFAKLPYNETTIIAGV